MALCLVRCSVPSQISLGRTPRVLDTAGREVNLKGAPEGLSSCERRLHWELTLQLMHADVPSKKAAKLPAVRCFRYLREECGARAWNSEIVRLTSKSISS